MTRYLCVLLGGGAGSLTRYLVNRAFVQYFPNANFVLGTLFVNVTGSFLIGVAMTLLSERFRLPHFWHLLAVVGFLGGYTTFSSFEYEGYLAVREGRFTLALLYLLGSVVLGFVALRAGVLLASSRA
jgi:CrcB protein